MEEDQIFNKVEEVFVSHVEDAVTFWAQCVDKSQEITKLSEDLARTCPTMSSVFGNPDLRKIYGGLFSEDKCWYRCKLLHVISDEKCHVTYIDYGNSEALNRSSIVELPDELQFPSLATKYRLWGLQLSNPDISLSQQGTTFLNNMILEKQITVRHKVMYKDNTVVVQAEYCTLDIGEEVSKKGFAVKCNSRNINEARKMDSPVCSPVKPRIPSPLYNKQLEMFPAGDQNSPAKLNRLQGRFNFQSPSLKKNENNSGNTPLKLSPEFTSGSAIISSNELKLIEENKKLKDDNDLILKKCQALESQIQFLRLQVKKEREIAEKTYRDQERCLNTAVADKLRSLSAKIESLKATRCENMNIRFGGDLSEAVRVVSEESLTAPSSLGKLEAIWKEYDFAQQKIRLCKDMGELDDLIAKRNYIQQNLFSAVGEFILQVDELSLADRTRSLQEISCSLETVYGEARDVECSDKVFHEFYEWKQAKIEKFSRVRHDTDSSLQVLFLWFNDLKEFFNLTSTVSLGSEEVVGNIDDLLKKVESDIDKELDISVLEQNETDKKIISNAYYKVVEKIHQEQELIKTVLSKHADSFEFRKQIFEWLNKSPNVDRLLAIKKTLKGLKSQLRWKSMERRSLEESDEYSESEVMKIKENIAELRNKTFTEIYREQEEYENLSCLVQKWFPELPLLHPEAGILNYMNSCGLLSVSLERDLFDAEPLKELSSKRPLVCADVQDQKVLLKGYSVSVYTEAKVIQRAAKYHKAWSELKEQSGLSPLLFLFFCKSDPLAYLMVPFYSGESLGDVQESTPLTSEEVVKVMKGVACGLQTLHKVNIVHGSVHPNNVFAVNRQKGILGDFDFTKTAEQRSLLNSVGSLNLTAPEVKGGQPASPSSDMYSYGCLLLWLFRGESWKLKSDGTPDMDVLSMAANIKSLLSRLVCCADRIKAAEVLEDDYFQMREAHPVHVPNEGMDGVKADEHTVHVTCASEMVDNVEKPCNQNQDIEDLCHETKDVVLI